MPTPRPPSRALRQCGFTLVELLVAVALGLLIMVALIAVYMNVSRTNSEMVKTNSMIENGRFAIDVLNEDLTHAGFWGGYVPPFDNFALQNVAVSGVPGTTSLALGPCLGWFAPWDDPYKDTMIGISVQAYGDGVPTGCSPSILLDRKAGTDVLIVRHAETCAVGEANCEAFDANKVYFQNSQCSSDASAYMLAKNANLADFNLRKRNCVDQADVRKFVSNIYFVRSWASTAGDGVPTLVRASFGVSSGAPGHEHGQALIEGIEAFRVELGIDSKEGRCNTDVDYGFAIRALPASTVASATVVYPGSCAVVAATPASNTLPTRRGDGVPDSFVHCPALGCTATQLRDAVAVKVYVIARSRDATPQHVDEKTYTLGSAGAASFSGSDRNYKRHLFQTTVRLNNISARRETPPAP